MVITVMMTKKQLMQALAILKDDDVVLAAVNKGKYSSDSEAYVSGVKIIFKQDFPQAIILVNESNLLEAA